MSVSPEATEDVVRQLARLQLSTRKIAAQTGLSQSTVVRTLAKINSGPQPVLRDDTPTDPMRAIPPDYAPPAPAPDFRMFEPPSAPVPQEFAELELRREKPGSGVIAVMAGVILLLSAAVLMLGWLLHNAGPGQPARVAACVQFSHHGFITDLSAMPAAGGCPGNQKMIMLLAP